MNTRILLVLGTVATFTAPGAIAQQSQGGSMPSQSQQTAVELPEACRTAVQASAQGDMMQKMQTSMSQSMQGMMGQMNETQKGLHEAMMKMNRPMMMGMRAKDADVAWICSMIPHHQGAIDMTRAGMKGADNEESKKLAEETIQSNERELKKLTEWVEKHAQKESRDEATGSTK
jgi:uncharacterized protein (DUF305 family)